MRLVIALLIYAAAAGCVAEPAQRSAPQTLGVAEATRSVLWNPRTMGPDDLWPQNAGVRSTQVIFKKAPDRPGGSTFFAFVVWNGNFIGKIYRVGGLDGDDFRDVLSHVTAGRTAGAPSFSTSSTGNVSAGPVKPTPGPQVDDIRFSSAYLTSLKRYATIILDATTDLIELDDDKLGP